MSVEMRFDCGHGPALHPSGEPLTYYFFDNVWERTYCAHCGNKIVCTFSGTHDGKACEPAYQYTDRCLELETISLRNV